MNTNPQLTSRPERVFLTAEWRYLAMLNYAVDPVLLLPHVPLGTELDTFNDKTYVTSVAFRFLATRLLGFSIPFHHDFNEVNPRFAIAAVARLAYNENYRALPMAHRIEHADDSTRSDFSVEYSWRLKPHKFRLQVLAGGEAYEAARGSLEQFITEHYWGYSAQPDNTCVEYRVAHPAWRLWQVREARHEGDFAALYGREFPLQLSRPPYSWPKDRALKSMPEKTCRLTPRGPRRLTQTWLA